MQTPTARDSLLALGLGFLVLLAANALVALVVGMATGDFSMDPARLAGPGLVVQGLAMLAFVSTIGQWTTDGPRRSLGLLPARRWWLVLFIVPAGLLSDVVVMEAQRMLPWLDRGGMDALAGALEKQRAWVVIGAVGLAPVYEELLFRGFAWTGLERSLGRWGALVVTTLIFAAFHADPLHITGVLVVGFWLGWIRMATGSVIPAIAAHLLNNLVWALLGGMLPIEQLPRWWALPCLVALAFAAALSFRLRAS